MSKESRPSLSIGGWSPSEEFLDQTIETWQPYAKHKLTREDAREITTNIVGFFKVLREWQREDEARLSSQIQGQSQEPGLTKSKTPTSSS